MSTLNVLSLGVGIPARRLLESGALDELGQGAERVSAEGAGPLGHLVWDARPGPGGAPAP